ncbi:MAG: YceI family protein [Streptosporangiaceae bacterium]
MQALSGQLTAPALQALLRGGTLAGQWGLDPHRSSVRLRNSSAGGLLRVNGAFREVSGTGTVTADGEVSGTVVVTAASIDTGNTRRDTHLRSADFFDAERYPDITFTADGIQLAGPHVTVAGALTVRDTTRALSFDAAASVPGDGEIWLRAGVHINRGDFGLTWNRLGLVSMHNTLTIHAVFTRR